MPIPYLKHKGETKKSPQPPSGTTPHMATQNPPKPTPTLSQPSKQEAPPPPPQISSPLSSPTHEFSFTITLHPSLISTPSPSFTPSNKALNLSTTDDIFLPYHLLPLHLLPHPSRRPSIDQNLNHPCITHDVHNNNNNDRKEKKRSNSFSSLFRRKVFYLKQTILKKYADMIEAIRFSRGEKAKHEIRRRPHSYSASSLSSAKERERWMMRRRGELSAPVSMRASPRNSGLLLATPVAGMSSASSESSMEELQSAIQAAIAHCKSSSTAAKERQV